MQRKNNPCHEQSSQSSQPQIKSYLPSAQQVLIDKSIFSHCLVLCIVDDSFIVIHHQGDIYLIDQHAACEKILYMENYQQIKTNRDTKLVKQKTTYRVPNLYKRVLEDNRKDINELGWYFELGQSKGAYTQIHIQKQPYILTKTLGQQELVYYLQQMYDNQENQWKQVKSRIDVSDKQKQILAEYACHKSYRFGQKISLDKALQIVRKLGHIQAPFNCPHSRILISYYGSAQQIGLA